MIRVVGPDLQGAKTLAYRELEVLYPAPELYVN
jgi:hypothetical protein